MPEVLPSQDAEMAGERATASYTYLSKRFEQRDVLLKSAKDRWGPERIAINMNEATHMPDAKSEPFAVCGTVYKEMELRPVVVDDLHKKSVFQVPVTSKHCSEKDSIAIEDEISRVGLCGDIDVGSLVTGCVIAVRGLLTDDGKINVIDWILPGAPAIAPLPAAAEKTYIAFVSGLHIGSTFFPALSMLRDLFLGNIGSDQQKQALSRVARLVVCGNSFKFDDTDDVSRRKAMADADVLFSQLASVVKVDVMTGDSDPANFSLPQPPMHPSFFPQSNKLKSFRCVPNPYDCKIGDTHIVGTSGHALDNAWAFCTTEKKLDVLEMTLESRHIAPTAPDTLSCNPMQADLFVMEGDWTGQEGHPAEGGVVFEGPHIYFAGNNNSGNVEHKKAESGTLCLSVPTFARECDSRIALVEASTLEVEVITLNPSV